MYSIHPTMRWKIASVIIFLPFTLGLLQDDNSYSFQCEGKEGVEFVNTNVRGRYNVTLCTAAKNYTQWDLQLRYHHEKRSKCFLNETSMTQYVTHSSARIYLNHTCDHDASVVCLTKSLDLIFTGCYSVSCNLYKNINLSPQKETMHFIDNNETREFYEQNIYNIETSMNSSGFLQVLWSSSTIPINDYTLEMCFTNNKICTCIQKKGFESNCKLSPGFTVEENCLSNKNCTYIQEYCIKNKTNEVNCIIPRVLAGDYALIWDQNVYWSDILFHDKIKPNGYYFFTVENTTSEVQVNSTGTERILLFLTCACMSVVIAVFLSPFVVHKLKYNSLKPNQCEIEMQQPITYRLTDVSCQLNLPKLLVLYASDVMTEGKALIKLFQDNGFRDVLDIQSAEVAAMAAPACYEWIADMIKDDKWNIVILQSPGMYQESATSNDDMVSCAKRFFTERLIENNYVRFFVAKFPGAEELLPLVASEARYEIPWGVSRLLSSVLCLQPGGANFVGIEEFRNKVLSGNLD